MSEIQKKPFHQKFNWLKQENPTQLVTVKDGFYVYWWSCRMVLENLGFVLLWMLVLFLLKIIFSLLGLISWIIYLWYSVILSSVEFELIRDRLKLNRQALETGKHLVATDAFSKRAFFGLFDKKENIFQTLKAGGVFAGVWCLLGLFSSMTVGIAVFFTNLGSSAPLSPLFNAIVEQVPGVFIPLREFLLSLDSNERFIIFTVFSTLISLPFFLGSIFCLFLDVFLVGYIVYLKLPVGSAIKKIATMQIQLLKPVTGYYLVAICLFILASGIMLPFVILISQQDPSPDIMGVGLIIILLILVPLMLVTLATYILSAPFFRYRLWCLILGDQVETLQINSVRQ